MFILKPALTLESVSRSSGYLDSGFALEYPFQVFLYTPVTGQNSYEEINRSCTYLISCKSAEGQRRDVHFDLYILPVYMAGM